MNITVTGAFGYSGRAIARVLLADGHKIRTLTNTRPEIDPFQGEVQAFSLDFNQPEQLVLSLTGSEVLINTYWVRFNHKTFTHDQAVENTRILFEAAKKAGIKRVVHTSIANPSKDSPFEYYRGKAQIEEMLIQSGLSYTILRPTVIYSSNDILINNIAWTLRHFPVMGIFGNGRYRIRPIHLNDFAELAAHSVNDTDNKIIDAVGPEDYTYRELIRVIARSIGCSRVLLPIPVFLGLAVARLVGWWHNDVFLTREEIGGLMANLLTSDAPATGTIRLSEWLHENVKTVGTSYASELARRRSYTAERQ